MTVCRITNDGVCIDTSVDVSKLHKREEVTIKTFVVSLFSPDAPGEKVYQSSILEYPLPRPFDNYLYNSPVFMQFTGGTVESDEHAERLITLLGNIFTHIDDSLEETPSIIYEKIENQDADYVNQEDEEEYYNPELSDDEDENDEDVEYSEDEEDDESKLEGDSQMGDDTSLK